ncbi:nuclear transport factor 2 family protein [Arthrobacter rhombi]
MSLLELDSLLIAERAGWDSLCNGTGSSFYGNLMTPAGLMIISNGMILDRSDVEASLDGAPTWDSYKITEPRLVSLGSDTAALVYHAQSIRGDEAPFIATMTSIYCVLDGQLRLALYQQMVASSQE